MASVGLCPIMRPKTRVVHDFDRDAYSGLVIHSTNASSADMRIGRAGGKPRWQSDVIVTGTGEYFLLSRESPTAHCLGAPRRHSYPFEKHQ